MGIRTTLTSSFGSYELGKIYFREDIEGIEFWHGNDSDKLEIFDTTETLRLLDGIVIGTIARTELFEPSSFLNDYTQNDFKELKEFIENAENIEGYVG